MTSRVPCYDDLGALFFNCTLKRSPEPSNTQGLIDVSAQIMQKQGVSVRRRSRHRDPGVAGYHERQAGRQ